MELNVKHIKDFDVKVSLLRNFPEMSDESRTVAYYMASKYPYSGLLISEVKSTSDKYVVYGNNVNVLYVSLILNSIAGKLQFTDSLGNFLPVNTKSVSKALLPSEINVDGFTYGTILESYIQSIYAVADSESEDSFSEELQSLQILQSFLSLIRNYYVEQLYLPDFFKAKGIDIIKPWSEIVNKTLYEENGEKIIEYTKNIMASLGSEDNPMMEALNKMKFYYLEVINALKERLKTTLS